MEKMMEQAEITEHNLNFLIKQVQVVIQKLGLTDEQAWTEGGNLNVPRICNHIQETLDALAQATAFGQAMSDKYGNLQRLNRISITPSAQTE